MVAKMFSFAAYFLCGMTLLLPGCSKQKKGEIREIRLQLIAVAILRQY